MRLIYRDSRDGTTADIFHKKCDNQGPTICLYMHEKGYFIVGYASISWKNTGGSSLAKDSFIFNLTNIYNSEPTKFPNSNSENSLYYDPSYCPNFHNDIFIREDFINSNSYSSFPENYKDILVKRRPIFIGDTKDNKNTGFKVKVIEVFKLIK